MKFMVSNASTGDVVEWATALCIPIDLYIEERSLSGGLDYRACERK